jgi:hypothetical protein
MGKKPAPECGSLEASIQLRCVALACIQERQRLLELLKMNSASEGCNEAFNVALISLSDLEPVSRDIRLAFVRYCAPTIGLAEP